MSWVTGCSDRFRQCHEVEDSRAKCLAKGCCGNVCPPWFATHRQADRLTFKDVFRHAAKHALIPADACERWLRYRDNRNTTAHDYGERFAEATLKLLPAFIADANALADVVEEPADD